MKKILIASLATTALMTQVSFAEMKLGNFGTLGGSVGVQSQKISKGFVGNRNTPGAFVGVDYNSPIGAYLSLVVAQDRSDPGTRQGQTYNYEACTTPGFKTKLGQINVDVSYENCAQESATVQGTYQFKFNTDVNKVTNIFFNYYNDTTDGSIGADGRSKVGDQSYEAGASYNFGPAVGKVAYLLTEKTLDVWSVGASKEIVGVNFDLTGYHVTANGNRNYISASTASTINKDHIILTATKNF
jgi:predicted porin